MQRNEKVERIFLLRSVDWLVGVKMIVPFDGKLIHFYGSPKVYTEYGASALTNEVKNGNWSD